MIQQIWGITKRGQRTNNHPRAELLPTLGHPMLTVTYHINPYHTSWICLRNLPKIEYMGFPKIVVPQIIHFIAGFSIINHSFLGITHSRKPPYSLSSVILDVSNRNFVRINYKSIEQIKDLQQGYPQLPKDPGSIIDLKDGVCTERNQHSHGPTNISVYGCIS